MGQAKQRGTFEERKALAVAKKANQFKEMREKIDQSISKIEQHNEQVSRVSSKEHNKLMTVIACACLGLSVR